MSYDVSLHDPVSGEVLRMPEVFTDGGTYCVGGSDECDLNITYNYSEVFGSLVRDLHGKSVAETRDALAGFVARWPDARPYMDYWAPTPGNAKKAVERLLSFADAHPHGVWRVA